MARKPRIHEPGGHYHVMLRGNGGEPIFFGPKDRLFFYSLLDDAVSRYGCRIHAFCLMENHVHLLLQVGEIALSKIIQNISFRYTRRINDQKKRVGHLFQGRYKAILADEKSYLLELIRYIHLNPVRARVVRAAGEWKWSGHNAYLGREALAWLTVDAALRQFGGNVGTARERYATFVAEGCDDAMTARLRKGREGGRILGDDHFVEKTLKEMAQGENKPKVSVERIMEATARVLGVRADALTSPGRERKAANARAIICLLARRYGSIPLVEMSRKFGRNDSVLSRAISRIEGMMEKDQTLKRAVNKITKVLEGD